MSPTVTIIAIFSDFVTYFVSKVTLNSYVTLSLTFSESFFKQNVSVERKLLRFSSIFLFQNKARNAGRSHKNAGNEPKCVISHTIAGRLTPMTLTLE